MKLKCSVCKEFLEENDFWRNSSKITRFCRHDICKICEKPRQKAKKRKNRNGTMNGHIRGIFHAAKGSAIRRNLEFTINRDDLNSLYKKQNGICALSGLIMTNIHGHNKVYTNLSIDRIDSSKGYIKNNIQLVCYIINQMKRDIPDSEFIDFCSRIAFKAA